MAKKGSYSAKITILIKKRHRSSYFLFLINNIPPLVLLKKAEKRIYENILCIIGKTLVK
ncbi:predicted protein [Listeria monocytogenes FSL J2-071]|nr:predicted protein [Listeria monocytogenes FSL J2-071]